MITLSKTKCLKCAYSLYDTVVSYSVKTYGYALCKKCQEWYKQDQAFISRESKRLYLALRERGVNVEMEKSDGFKHIDLAITGHRINLEVDGSQHYTKADQCMSDLKRTCHSLVKGYSTVRIPNVLLRTAFEDTADQLVEMLKKMTLDKRKTQG